MEGDTTKGKIVHVGGWNEQLDAPIGWCFSDASVGYQCFTDGRAPLIAGYSLDELRQVYLRARVEGNADGG